MMPNHITNIVAVSGDDRRIQAMLKEIQTDEYGMGSVDFNKIIPMPDEADSYNWCIANWGSKWNSYGYTADTGFKDGKLTFLTAWSAPHPILQRLSEMFPDIEFEHEWADEDIGMNCGRYAYYDGERIEEYYPESNRERIEFAARVMDSDPSEWCLYLNASETDYHLYEQQTDLRNLLKKESELLMKSLAEKISQNNNFNQELMNLVARLHEQLAELKGKKVYGYLKPDVKKTVDEIFSKLASNESIKKMYDLWCEMEQQKHDVYSSAKVQFPNLVDNKEFKSVKNMIVQTVMQMEFPTVDIEIEIPEPTEIDLDIPMNINEELIDETIDDSVEISPQSKLYIKWSDSYKDAHKLIFSKESKLDDYKKAEDLLLSESNDVLALYDLGNLYSMEKSGLKDDKKSFEFYEKALQGFIQIEPNTKKIKSYLQYQIGTMYFQGLGNPVDNKKAVGYFEKSAELGNQYAKRLLAFEYISGKKFEQNIEKGIALLTECADSGDAFSCYKLGNLYLNGEIINQDLDKTEKYLLSAEDNEFTQYALGKLYLQKEKYDIEKAISYFEKFADKNIWASYQLGRLYLFGTDGLKKDQEKAMEFLNLSAEQGNECAQNLLDNTEQLENEMLASTIFSLFINLSRCIEDDYHRKFQSGRKMIDSKLRRMIQEKNQALGIKQEHGQTQEY